MRQPSLPSLLITVAVTCFGPLGCSDDGECPPGQINVGGGACRSPGAGGGGARTAVCGADVKINEVLYDPEGSETDMTRTARAGIAKHPGLRSPFTDLQIEATAVCQATRLRRIFYLKSF